MYPNIIELATGMRCKELPIALFTHAGGHFVYRLHNEFGSYSGQSNRADPNQGVSR